MATTTSKTTAKKTTAKTTAKTNAAAQDAFKIAEDFGTAAQEQFLDAVDTLTGNNEEIRGQFEKTQKQFTEASTEFAEVAQAEISDMVQFGTDLAGAKTFADAMTVQQDYWTNLFQNRVERTQELTKTATDTARETFEPMTASFGSSFDTSKLFGNFFPSKA